MSDKKDRKTIEEYANLRQEYNKVMFGLDISAKKVEQDILSKFSINAISIEVIEEDIIDLKKELDSLKIPNEEVITKKLKSSKGKK